MESEAMCTGSAKRFKSWLLFACLAFQVAQFNSCATVETSEGVARGPLKRGDYGAIFRGYKEEESRYLLWFAPSGHLRVDLDTGKSRDRFTFDLEEMAGGGVSIQLMELGFDRSIYFAGKELATGNAVIFVGSLRRKESDLVLDMSPVMNSPIVGDITGMADITEANGALAIFDYSHAQLSYVNLKTGELKKFIDSQDEEGLREMQGLTGGPARDEKTHEISGCGLYLYEDMKSSAMLSGRQVFIMDLEGNATVDKVLDAVF